MAIHRQHIHKVTFRWAKTGNNPTDRSKLDTKRHILTEKKGIPLSVIISPASTHDIKLVTEAVDKAVIKRPKSLSGFKPRSRRRLRRLQHLCLDKGYKSTTKEQELTKRGYLLHIPIKKKKKGEDGKEEEKEIDIGKQIRNFISFSRRRKNGPSQCSKRLLIRHIV